ncbi:MAG: hypothetical protein ABI649_03245 [Gaiellaceae bacterium]
MTLVLEIGFAAALGIVAVSFLGLVTGKASDRLLVWIAVALALVAGAAGAALGISIVENHSDTETLLLATGGLAASALAEAGLVALARGFRRLREIERFSDQARSEIAAFSEGEARTRILELERVLARERANTGHQLSEQERRLAEERRDSVERQAERARVELTQAVASVQERLERRLMGWAADLDRGQRELERQLAELGRRQQESVSAYESRLAADAERVDAASEEQRLALLKLREELQRFGTAFLEEGRSDIEVHAAERRRALHEVSERIRIRERAMREQLDREETEARNRIAAGLGEAERRHLAALDRALERAATRLSEYSEKQFDAQIKESREKAAERLSRELEKSIEQFARQAESDVAGRIAEMARMTADRLQRRVTDVARAAETQHEVAADRVRHLSARLEEALAAAEERLAVIEAEMGSSVRASDRD